ncbi:DUF4810 domain-containing protein [Rhodoferax sp.]|uniref:DUF4810 domain-containing protein n=1 Tax=Rhodoferax sp. TaxID=50421 RepID=UPI00374CCBB6
MKTIFAPCLLGLALLTGCATKVPTLYQWGSYQDQVYTQYSDPGKVPVEEQIAKLEAAYQKVELKDRKAPPGYYAHLGYLYFQAGKADLAVHAFETEKTLFPESVAYMDLLIKHAQK